MAVKYILVIYWEYKRILLIDKNLYFKVEVNEKKYIIFNNKLRTWWR